MAGIVPSRLRAEKTTCDKEGKRQTTKTITQNRKQNTLKNINGTVQKEYNSKFNLINLKTVFKSKIQNLHNK